MRPAELLHLLQSFHEDKLRLMLRHEASARQIVQYDFNNTYQYVIAREEMHLTWLADAIAALDGSLPQVSESPATPPTDRGAHGAQVIEEDAAEIGALLQRWGHLIEGVTNARHRRMLEVILGEMLEHRRFFEQALAGRTDLLGRRGKDAVARGEVLPTRWIE